MMTTLSKVAGMHKLSVDTLRKRCKDRNIHIIISNYGLEVGDRAKLTRIAEQKFTWKEWMDELARKVKKLLKKDNK